MITLNLDISSNVMMTFVSNARPSRPRSAVYNQLNPMGLRPKPRSPQTPKPLLQNPKPHVLLTFNCY